MLKKNLLFPFLFLFLFHLSFIQHPFNYDLHLFKIPGKNPQAMITAHGMGGSYKIGEWVKTDKTVISFNFPDYLYSYRNLPAHKTTFGTINEILPLLYVIKNTVIIEGEETVDLYGFSAGGGAIINAIGILNSNRYNDSLKNLGINEQEKIKMLKAIESGLIILDTPLKSVAEIVNFRTREKDLREIAQRYKKNGMEPIDSLKYLKGLSLNIIVHFQNPDEVLSNRDDQLFYETLKKYNSEGKTKLIIGYDNGHMLPHPTLWNSIHK